MNSSILNALSKIDMAMNDGSYEEAVKTAYEVLSLPFGEVDTELIVRTSVVLGFAFIKLRRFEEAKQVLQPLLNNNLASVDALYLLFCIAFEENNRDEIISYGSRFLDAVPDPKNPPVCITTAVQNAYELVNNLATALLNEGEGEKAIEFLKKGLEFKHDFPLLYINLGIALYRQEKFTMPKRHC